MPGAQDPASRSTCDPYQRSCRVCDPGGLICGSSKRQQPHRPQLTAIATINALDLRK